jgi:hypothetical protein
MPVSHWVRNRKRRRTGSILVRCRTDCHLHYPTRDLSLAEQESHSRVMMIGLIVFSVLLYRSEAPMIIQAISLPGPDFGGLKRAGIEWNQAYAETVVELTNSLSHDYHDLDIQIGTSDTIFQVGETSNLKCVSLNGEQFLAIHRVRCPLLPGGATIQLAVITVILNQQQGTMPKNLFLPPKPPSSVTVRVDYNRGKRSYSAESSGDSRREQNRTK